jgi:hypothetical protein
MSAADDGCVGQLRRRGLRPGEERQRIEAARDEERRDTARDRGAWVRGAHRKPSRKVVPEKASNVAAQKVRDTRRKAVAQFQEPTQVLDSMPVVAERSIVRHFGATEVKVSMPALAGRSVEDIHAQVPDSMRALAERNLEQMRKRCEHSVNALETALESWEDSLDAAGQGAVALNRKIRDIAERNISTGFDLASRLARATSVAEAMEVQADYWRKQLGELSMQAEEVRVLLQKVTSSVVEPIKAQVTREMNKKATLQGGVASKLCAGRERARVGRG